MSNLQKNSLARLVAVLFAASVCVFALAQESRRQQPKLKPVPMNPGPLGPAGYITLLPVDDRPAASQFAQMVGKIADHRVITPPREMLGRFTQPADTARIGEWLRAQDYSKTDAVIVSVDMLAYGGLMASRRPDVTFDEAKKRLEFFHWFKRKNPRVPVYAFSAIMRVAPAASAETRGVHDKDYPAASKRNLQINLAMLDLVKAGVVNEMVLLQDDARQFGLHRQDQAALKDRLKRLGLESRVPIYNGAGEGSISLVSRAILDKFLYKLRVAIIYSSENSRDLIPPFEDHPLQYTVESRIRAAGGIPVSEYDKSDYTLFINAPGTDAEEFDLFLKKMLKELREARYVALADLLFPKPHFSGADERVIAALKRENMIGRLDGYAAWNTAGATLGAVISHANMRVFYKTKLNDGVERTSRAEAAHLESLFHRYVCDYLYHDIVRFDVNRRMRPESENGSATYQLTPEKYEQVNREVEQKLGAEIEKFFDENFRNRTHTLAYYNNVKRSITLKGLKDLKIYLPWPLTFEVAVEYRLDYTTN